MSRLTASALGIAIMVPLVGLGCSSARTAPGLSARATVAPSSLPASIAPAPTLATPRASTRASRQRQTTVLPTLLLRIRSCESGPNGYATHGWAFDADYHATNPRSTASGAWQVLRGTWDHYRGYDTAQDAPVSVQDAFAVELYAARGTQPWTASRPCWGRP